MEKEELLVLIEKMKCCGNCKHDSWWYDDPECPHYTKCKRSSVGIHDDSWEIKDD